MSLFDLIWGAVITSIRNLDHKVVTIANTSFCVGLLVGGVRTIVCIVVWLVIRFGTKMLRKRIEVMLADPKIKAKYEVYSSLMANSASASPTTKESV